MASFYVTVTPTSDGTGASIYGKFSGGDSSYSYQKLIYVSIPGIGTVGPIYSTEQSGGENTFSGSVTGLTPGTSYTWSASLYVRTTGGWTASSYTDSGSFATPGSSGGGTVTPTEDGYIWVSNGSGWQKGIIWVSNGTGWQQGVPWVSNGTGWSKGG